MTDLRDRAVQLYDAFTHEHRDRRQLLRKMTALAGSAAAAEALVAAIAAAPAAAAPLVDPLDPRLVTRLGPFRLADGTRLQGYLAQPRQVARSVGSVVVLHENRGLNPHIADVARRLALAGFQALAPDFLSDAGGTPPDEDEARRLIAAADLGRVTAEAAASVEYLRGLGGANGRVGAVGFCWGGALANRLAVAAGDRLGAAVAYYGPAPDPAEAPRVRAPVLLHYAGKDARVNATGAPWTAALRAAGVAVEAWTYPGVDHAFSNDTSPARYDKAAADLAWRRTLAFLHRHLDG
jgi:carboxymethylenebutenolidase